MSYIQATLDDCDLLSGYLHDSTFRVGDVSWDQAASTFALRLERPGYEFEKQLFTLLGRALRRYPPVPCVLRVAAAGEPQWTWVRPDDAESLQELLYIAHVDTALWFEVAAGTLVVPVSEHSVIALEDTGSLIDGVRTFHFGQERFGAMAEIDRLRRDA